MISNNFEVMKNYKNYCQVFLDIEKLPVSSTITLSNIGTFTKVLGDVKEYTLNVPMLGDTATTTISINYNGLSEYIGWKYVPITATLTAGGYVRIDVFDIVQPNIGNIYSYVTNGSYNIKVLQSLHGKTFCNTYDICIVGGGGNGGRGAAASSFSGGGGGGGGYVNSYFNISTTQYSELTVDIASQGGTTSCPTLGYTAAGGTNGQYGGSAGTGGSTGGTGKNGVGGAGGNGSYIFNDTTLQRVGGAGGGGSKGSGGDGGGGAGGDGSYGAGGNGSRPGAGGGGGAGGSYPGDGGTGANGGCYIRIVS